MFKTRSALWPGFVFHGMKAAIMAFDPHEERSLIGRHDKIKSSSRLWIIPASVIFHILVVALFVQWPQLQLNAEPEEVISLQIIPEPPPEPEPDPEAPAEEVEAEPPVAETPPAPSILPNIAIRPDVETQLDAVDSEVEQEAAVEPSEPVQEETEPSPEEQAEAKVADEQQGFGEETSPVGELPVGEDAPEPTAKPSVEPNEQPLEERTPLSNSVIEQSGLRQILGDLPPRRRLIQICTIEAISQIRAASADYAGVRGVIPASDDGLLVEGGKLTARGGAFNLGGRWVELDFTCEADLNTYRVLSFSQRIGSELSRAEAEARGFSKYE
jgi:hypothetical protein